MTMDPEIKTDPHNGTPVYGEPRFDEQQHHDEFVGDPELEWGEPDTARWDLSGGACLSFGRMETDGPMLVNLSLSDYAMLTGIVQRIVTREQIIAHAQHLLRLAAGQDETEALVRRAIGDPKQFCPRRRRDREPRELETVTEWCARAVLIALETTEAEPGAPAVVTAEMSYPGGSA